MSKFRIFGVSVFSLALAISLVGAVPSTSQAITSTSEPVLSDADAMNTGGTSAKEAGDSIVLEFSESTNKFAITAANIATELSLNNSHSFLDGAGALGSAEWSDDGEELTIVLSAGTSLPTVAVGDTVTIEGDNIKDLDDNVVTGSEVIGGSFVEDDEPEVCPTPSPTPTPTATPTPTPTATPTPSPTATPEPTATPTVTPTPTPSPTVASANTNRANHIEDDEDDGDDNDCDGAEAGRGKFRCGTGLQNGRLYKIADSPTVYLMAACRLKPFRGAAAFHSRGLKFQDVIVLPSLPPNVIVSNHPVIPAEGTLIKGTDKTVWFVDHNGKRRGFTSAEVFHGLGFSFDEVDQITDSDLGTVSVDNPINTEGEHPDGSLIKCGNSAAVFIVIGNLKFPFANADAFKTRGHSFDHILNVDCGRFAYREGAPITTTE